MERALFPIVVMAFSMGVTAQPAEVAQALDDDEVAIEIDEHSNVMVNFPQASDDECVFRYNIVLRDSNGASIASKWLFSGFFLGRDMPKSLSLPLDGMTEGESYRVEVKAYDSYDNASCLLISNVFTAPAGEHTP